MKSYLTIILLIVSLSFVFSDVNERFIIGQNPEGWSIQGTTNNLKVSDCGGVSLLGGFNVAGRGATATKKFKTDSSKKQITIEFDLYAIDSWDNEIFYVTGNGEKKQVF